MNDECSCLMINHSKKLNLDLDSEQKDNEGLTLFWKSSEKGHLLSVKALLKQKELTPEEQSSLLHGCLQIAFKNGHYEILKLLLQQKGKFVLDRDSEGKTVMFYACQEGNIECISILIKDMQQRDLTLKDQFSCLIPGLLGATFGDKYVDPIKRNQNGYDALYFACKNGYSEAVAFLLQNSFEWELNHKFDNACTYLMIACLYRHFEVCHLLLQQPDLDTNITNNLQNTAFILACISGEGKIVKMMLEVSSDRKINLNHRGLGGCTGFVKACQKKHEHIVKLLVTNSAKYNIDLNVRDNAGKSGFEYWPEKFPKHFKGWNLILIEDDEEMETEPEPTTKDPTELLKMVHSLQNDLQSRDSTAPEMLVTLESIGRQYAKEVQAKKYLQPKISSVFKQNNQRPY